FTILVYYSIANLAALRMSRGAKLVPDAVPLFGLLACVTLAMALSATTIVTGITVLLAGFVFRGTLRAIARA
ncbi:MAG: amino acid permease, partial [Gemmatimonadales bacterium]|nr:amino acid permease [Gemmatimonadales bacterium]